MPQPEKRKALSKKLRFTVFARDNFTCRYCGRQSDKVQLVIDHIVPVAGGGTNDIENLITACFECNSGKGARSPTQAAPTEADRLRLLQETREQESAFRKMQEAMQKRKEMKQMICNFYCESRGQKSMSSSVLGVLASFVDQHGHEPVLNWIEIASSRLPESVDDLQFVKYVCGIRRRLIENREIESPAGYAKPLHP